MKTGTMRMSAGRDSNAFLPAAREGRTSGRGPTVVIPDISTIPLGIETVGSAPSGGPWLQGPLLPQSVGVGHVRVLKLDATMCGRSI